jgi:hypothetical protein
MWLHFFIYDLYLVTWQKIIICFWKLIVKRWWNVQDRGLDSDLLDYNTDLHHQPRMSHGKTLRLDNTRCVILILKVMGWSSRQFRVEKTVMNHNMRPFSLLISDNVILLNADWMTNTSRNAHILKRLMLPSLTGRWTLIICKLSVT